MASFVGGVGGMMLVVFVGGCATDSAPDAGSGAARAAGGSCDTTADCLADEFCAAVCLDSHGCRDTCHEDAPVEGKCAPRPTQCEAQGAPVVETCGCDGKLYASTCDAERAGVRPSASNKYCPAPAGKFSCGGAYCSASDQYCVFTSRAALGGSSACQTMPVQCVGPPIDCSCLQTQTLQNNLDLDGCSSCEPSGEGLLVSCLQN